VAVVIDVLRAFTSAAFMMHLGAKEIVLLEEASAVLDFKVRRGYLAVGEEGGRKPPGFDLGNSPSRILAAGRSTFAGRRVAQRTSAGTRGAVAAAVHADQVILGSYVTAGRIARYIHALAPQPAVVTLVAMGAGGFHVTPDDEGCAAYIEHLLAGKAYDHSAALQEILGHECALKFLRGDQDHYPPADPIYCLQRDLFDFVLVTNLEGGQLVAKRANPS
jgi:2-phosphosulfolactate phosphatase